MKHDEAVDLIRDAVGRGSGPWADLGCGAGTFTRALVEILGPRRPIVAVDRDSAALDELRRWSERHGSHVHVVRADFTKVEEIAELRAGSLDGILLANALHFVRDAGSVLARLVPLLRPAVSGTGGGRVVFVEYDRRDASRWVPYPISRDRLVTLAASAGLNAPTVIASRPSQYQGLLYTAFAERSS
jgi:SAM-dependent methyltransferase